ncbi:MBL fold metallo-hydrolase [Halocynthiibacter sp. C4]|uniref:MBL fold metallo-hydrolase n=1 Tax=Halocynthiibacter sp. C4 TaxID=2992758 RepID=UPI00237AD495|nr:MBL fold metallo-hydrolase [Halocynthiibacter sp. C4]MDE0590824.1 MBL fold metallo-hydrolase [Halocynthiibacter sp. C4]
MDDTLDPSGIRYPFETPPAEGEAIEVAEGVNWMRLPLPMKLDHVNVYALDDGASWTIVDTGFDTKRTRRIWEKLLSGPLAGKPVERVIVTHHHPDHIGLAGWFQTEFGAELVTTQTAWLSARMLTLDEQLLPTPETLTFWTRAGMDPEILAKRAKERPFNFVDMVAPLPLGFTRIREGSKLTAAGRDWTVRIGNGHAPEHACLFSDSDHLVLGGDQLLPSISPNIGVYATEPMADPLQEWLDACTHMAKFARPDQLILGGHKLPYTGLPTRLGQFVKNHEGALARLLTHLETPKTAVECFDVLFKRPIGEAEYGLALVEAVAHVNHLYLNGNITRTLEEDGAWRWRKVG